MRFFTTHPRYFDGARYVGVGFSPIDAYYDLLDFLAQFEPELLEKARELENVAEEEEKAWLEGGWGPHLLGDDEWVYCVADDAL